MDQKSSVLLFGVISSFILLEFVPCIDADQLDIIPISSAKDSYGHQQFFLIPRVDESNNETDLSCVSSVLCTVEYGFPKGFINYSISFNITGLNGARMVTIHHKNESLKGNDTMDINFSYVVEYQDKLRRICKFQVNVTGLKRHLSEHTFSFLMDQLVFHQNPKFSIEILNDENPTGWRSSVFVVHNWISENSYFCNDTLSTTVFDEKGEQMMHDKVHLADAIERKPPLVKDTETFRLDILFGCFFGFICCPLVLTVCIVMNYISIRREQGVW